MAEKKVAVRIVFEGGKTATAQLVDFGREGQRAFQGLERSGRAGGAALQNVGYQVQDFAVQVAGGTDATRALAQQLPQLLSGFGLFGVLLGTATAVLAPFVTGLFDSSDAVDGLAGQLGDLESATRAYRQATVDASVPIDVLTEKFGGQAEAVHRLYQAQLALAQLDLAYKNRALNEGIAESFSGLTSALDNIDRVRESMARMQEAVDAGVESPERVLQIQEGLDVLIDGLGMSEEAARSVQGALDALAASEGPSAAAQAMEGLRTAILDAAGGYDNLTEEQAKLILKITEAQEAAIMFGATDMSGGLREANAEALTLVERVNAALTRAANAQDQLAQMRFEFSPGGQALLKYGSRGTTDARPVTDGLTGEAIMNIVSPTSSGDVGGGMSDAQKEQNDLMREAERVIAATRTEAEKYSDELGRLNDMLKEGYLNQDQYDRALAELKDKFGDLDEEARKTKDAFKDFFGSILSGSASAEEALGRLLESFATEMFSTGFDSLWGALFPSANGNVFSGGDVVPFANGGVVSSPTTFPMRHGRIGLMGEAGPEAIMPLKRGRDGKLGVAAGGAADGAGSVTVQVNVDARGAVDGVAAQVADAVRKQIPDIVQQAVAAVGAARKRGYAV